MLSEVDLGRIGRTVDQIFSLDKLRSKLSENRPLRIKYGVDVTAPFLHIGHAVNLWMMRYLQERGHIVVFLIGDFTTRIGDPTGKSQTREIVSRGEIEENAKEFIKQVGAVLITDPDVFEIRRNSEWYDQMPTADFVSLVSMVTHSKLIQRDMFQKRIQHGYEIYMHEVLYPILQGYDSVMLESDITIVGTDQLFNELMGRFYQEKCGQTPQVVITTKITPGTDGVEKQSKSLGNYIALADSPRDKFGKIMSIPDSLIIQYLEVYTLVPVEEIRALERSLAENSINPMDVKKMLAERIVDRYHGAEVAKDESQWFTETFSLRNVPPDIPLVTVSPNQTVLEVLRLCLPEQSSSAIKRLIKEGGVSVNDKKLTVADEILTCEIGDVIKVGKRKWFKISWD